MREYDILETWYQRQAMIEGITIYTARLILRPWCIKDLESLAKLYADLRVIEFLEVKSLEDTKKDCDHFVSSMKEYGWGLLGCRTEGRRPVHRFDWFGKCGISSPFHSCR